MIYKMIELLEFVGWNNVLKEWRIDSIMYFLNLTKTLFGVQQSETNNGFLLIPSTQLANQQLLVAGAVPI